MAKSYTWTAPLPQTINCVATPQAGGNLAANTTYYYRVVAVDDVNMSMGQSATAVYGQPSTEFSATTTPTNKQISLSWNAVAGAAAYYVFRTTVSDNYSGSKRFRRLTDQNNQRPTLTGTSFIDAGSYGLYATAFLGVMPIGSRKIDGLDYTVDFGGRLDVMGGMSGAPLTLANIYDWAVINMSNYQKYIYYDGYTFSLIASLNFNYGGENHFLATNKVLKIAKQSNFYNGNANSNIQFGELDSSGMTKNGCRVVNMGSFYAKIYLSSKCRLYATSVYSVVLDVEWTQGTNSLLGARWQTYFNVEDAKDIIINGFTYFGISANYPSVDLRAFVGASVELSYYTHGKLSWRIVTAEYFDMIWGLPHVFRLDEFTSYRSTHQYRIGNTTGQIVKVINPISPNSSDSEKLPIFLFVGAAGTAKVYFNILLKITDKDNNGLSGTKISIKDASENAGKDFSDTDITDIETDADGMFFKEKINITGVTASTITDSSKSWAADDWKGRNVYVSSTGEIMKVKSNTATIITFITNLLTTPAIGTRAGIIMELLRFSENQAGRTDCGLFEIELKRQGYATGISPLTLNKKISWQVRMVPKVVHALNNGTFIRLDHDNLMEI